MAVGSDIGLSLVLSTKPNIFEIGGTNQKFWKRMVLHDGLSAYAPYADLVLPDIGGLYNERFFFSEGLTINLRMGVDVPRYGFISHDFVWGEYQMNSESTREGNHPTGDATFILDSRFADEDSEKSRSFGNVKISQAVQNAMSSYNLTPVQPVHGTQTKGKLVVIESANSMVCTQPDETDAQFVQRMAQSAYNATYDKTGYVAFWNLRNEFYFAPLGYLLKQKPVATLTMSQLPTTLEDKNAIKNYGIYMGGTEVNRENYNQNLWTVNDSGVVAAKTLAISNHLFKANPRDKSTITKARLAAGTKSSTWYGPSTKTDVDAVKAYSNHLNIESNLAFRFEVMVPYHPDLVTGHVVELVIGSAFQNLQVAPEYSGNWLITSSDHHYDQDGYGVSRLNLGRGTINLRKDHPFYDQFV